MDLNGKLHPEAAQVKKKLSSEEMGGTDEKNLASKVKILKFILL